ncbi:zinc finger protein 395a [Esox lucius]|uniref:C2H2-type domain-containing protein n=1 Tax=Esox lucius TaxID=8010 RepID=A0A3P8Y6B3_ESOLU|nr:zinc finger protein 395a [Esox lucius]XP_012993092.2 zinc finger protein 395a [Esox lucius]XP_012993093.2 zinc finger protein 395a [Esox lucius]XP_034153476.1 zinc finger protein 395a [Esox lucius]
MLPKTRLGKRSPLGALMGTSCPTMEGPLETGGHRDPPGIVGNPMGPLGPQHLNRFGNKLHPGQKVYVLCGGRESMGVVEQHNHVDNEVSIRLQALGQHVLRKLEDVWTSPTTPPPAAHPPTQDPGRPQRVSSCIDVPRRSPESVDMDEMMAALVLTSLSCSPQVQSSSKTDAVSGCAVMESGCGELSDSGSSGYWSCDRGYGSPAPSPPIPETDSHSLATPSDEGLDMELEQVLFDEQAPRKRWNSVKVSYRCLWPNCGKMLTSVVGIKRHIRTLHLGQSSEHERCFRSEEDFYYTKIHQREPQTLTPPPGVPASSTTVSWIACTSPTRPSSSGVESGAPGAGADGDSVKEVSPQLSKSAPSTPGFIWQVRSEHSYQAPAPVHLVAPPLSASCCWTTPSSAPHPRHCAPVRVRSVSVGEQWLQQHSAPSRPQSASTSPPRTLWTTRRVRGEAKKCRKVYGIEHRDQWCTACRWKKACQRFLD